jgi:hypothetical protein
MADIYLSIQAMEQGIKRVAIEHQKGWIQGGLNEGRDTIYETHRNNDEIQTKLVNGYRWK